MEREAGRPPRPGPAPAGAGGRGRGACAASREPGSRAHDPIAHSSSTGWSRTSNRAGGLEGGITNGQDIVITAIKKPISTLPRGLPSVDLDTLEPVQGQYERSDVTALPAAGVIAESMVALVLADALLVKIGGDSMSEALAHFESTLAQQADPSRVPDAIKARHRHRRVS